MRQQVPCTDVGDQLHGTCHFDFYRHDAEVHETVESQVKPTVIFALQFRHDGQRVPLQHLLAVCHPLNSPRELPTFGGLLLLGIQVALIILGVLRRLKQSLGYVHTGFDRHRQCLIAGLPICSGLDKEGIKGRRQVSAVSYCL